MKLAPSKDLSVQICRSLIVSVIAFIADFGTLVVLKQKFGVQYLVAATLSFGLGVIINFYLSVRWVFADRKFASRHAEFSIFFVISAIGLALNLVIIAGLVQLAGIDYRLAKIASTIVVFFWNFIARKKVLY